MFKNLSFLMGKLFIALIACCLLSAYNSEAQTTIFSENIGSPSTNTDVDLYTGWQNSSPITFTRYDCTGTTDVRISSASSGYTGASGSGNVLLNATTKCITISGINTSSYTSLQLK